MPENTAPPALPKWRQRLAGILFTAGLLTVVAAVAYPGDTIPDAVVVGGAAAMLAGWLVANYRPQPSP